MLNKPLGMTQWWGWYSPTAVKCGCPVFLYRNKAGKVVKVTAVTFEPSGKAYKSDCKKPLGLLTEYVGNA